MYKKALQLGLRFPSSKGQLTTEQLWSLKLEELDLMAQAANQVVENGSKTKSFISKKSSADESAKLRLDILVDVIETMMAQDEAAKAKLDKKAHNQKIMALIEEKEGDKLKGMSIDELKKQLLED